MLILIWRIAELLIFACVHHLMDEERERET
jgi:hypothetical protein